MAKNSIISGNEGAFTRDVRRKCNDNFRDISLCTTEFDAVTGTTGSTLTNVVGMLSDTLHIGAYQFTIKAYCVATANTGIKMAFKFGTASMLGTVQYTAKAFTASGVVVTSGTTATDQALLLDSAAGVVIFGEITGVINVTVPGTLQFQAAQHTAHADTVSVFANSTMEFIPIGATLPLTSAIA